MPDEYQREERRVGERDVGPIHDSEFVTREEAAAILRVSAVTMGRWLRSGRVRARRVGNAWRIERKEIERVKREGLDASGVANA